MPDNELILSQSDYQRISALVKSHKTSVAELLEGELERASVVKDEELPKDVVSMNTKVAFRDLDADKEMELTLSYPHESDPDAQRISVMAPVGAALIGLRVGQIIDWPLSESRSKRIKVIAVSKEA